MKNQINEKLKNRVIKLIKKWKTKLHLSEWEFKVKFERDIAHKDSDWDIAADIVPNTAYMKGFMRIYPTFFQQGKYGEEQIIVHELVHCITQEAADLIGQLQEGKMVTQVNAQDVIERLTQRITNVVMDGE